MKTKNSEKNGIRCKEGGHIKRMKRDSCLLVMKEIENNRTDEHFTPLNWQRLDI